MSTKAQIVSKINTDLASASSITATEHRGVLHTSSDSILEAIYPTPYSEDSTGTHTVTTPNANFSYIVTITKIGRGITITGSLFCVNTMSAGAKVLEIDAAVTDYLGSGLSYGVATNSNTQEAIEIRMNGNELQTNASVVAGERFRFSITYKALN